MDASVFSIGDEHFNVHEAHVRFHRETDGDPWLMNLEIVTTPDDEEDDSPRLELHRIPLGVLDWQTLEGTKRRFADPIGDDVHEQNVFWGPHFENVGDLTVVFGDVAADGMLIEIDGVSFRPVFGTAEEERVAFRVRARCELMKPPPEQWSAEPPLGRKTCHACSGVSFDLVSTCPTCGTAGWWNPSTP